MGDGGESVSEKPATCKNFAAKVFRMAKNQHKPKWTVEDLNNAIEAVASGTSKRRAAARFGIPWGTFSDKLSGRRSKGEQTKTFLQPEEEDALVNHLNKMEAQGIGQTKDELLTSVKNMLDHRGRQTKWQDNKPSDKWYRLFKKRHPNIVFRHPSGRQRIASKPKWTVEDLNSALRAVESGVPKRQAAAQFGIPWGTFTDKLSGRRAMEEQAKTYLQPEEEEEIINHLKEMDARGIAQTKHELMMTVKNMLDLRGRQTKWKDNKPSEKWYRLFRKRHPNIFLNRPHALARRCTIVSEDVGDPTIVLEPERMYNATTPTLDDLSATSQHNPPVDHTYTMLPFNPSTQHNLEYGEIVFSPLPTMQDALASTSSNPDGLKDHVATLRKFGMLCSQIGESTLNLYYTRLDQGYDSQDDDVYSLWKLYYESLATSLKSSQVGNFTSGQTNNTEDLLSAPASKSGTQKRKTQKLPSTASGHEFQYNLKENEKSHNEEESRAKRKTDVDERKRKKARLAEKKKTKQEEKIKQREDRKKQKEIEAQTRKEERKRKREENVEANKSKKKQSKKRKYTKEDLRSDLDMSADESEMVLEDDSKVADYNLEDIFSMMR